MSCKRCCVHEFCFLKMTRGIASTQLSALSIRIARRVFEWRGVYLNLWRCETLFGARKSRAVMLNRTGTVLRRFDPSADKRKVDRIRQGKAPEEPARLGTVTCGRRVMQEGQMRILLARDEIEKIFLHKSCNTTNITSRLTCLASLEKLTTLRVIEPIPRERGRGKERSNVYSVQ